MSRLRLSGGRWLLGLMLWSMALPALAIDARVRAVVDQPEGVWIGQQVVLKVELLSDGQSFGDQSIRLPDIPGALVLEDTVSTVRLNESVEGDTWQVLSYHYQMFPQRAGDIEIPPIDVAFTVSEGYGSEPVPFALQTEPVALAVSSPPGVDDPSGLVTTTKMTLTVEVSPDPQSLKVGDALTRTVTRSAPAVSGMAFAPMPLPVIPGVAVYPKPPDVDDRSNRGELVGKRVESTTYVLQQDGQLTIPGIDFQWWDPVAGELHVESVPALEFEVAVNPDLIPSPAERVLELADQRPWLLFSAALMFVAAIAAGIRWLPAGLRRLRRWQAARRISEGARFKRLLRACRQNDPAQAYNAYTAWLSGEDAPPSAALQEERLVAELQRLQLALVGRQSGWRADGLARALQRARLAGRRQARQRATQVLPALNP